MLKENPNIYLIVIDSLRYDFVSYYRESNELITPNIDKIAKESEVFVNAMSCAAHTLPSFASILTGKYPSKLGFRIFSKLSKKQKTIPYFLKKKNYWTVSAFICGKENNLTKDFDTRMRLSLSKLNGIGISKLNSKLYSIEEFINYLLKCYNRVVPYINFLPAFAAFLFA